MPISNTRTPSAPTEQQIRAFAESEEKTLRVVDGHWEVELPANPPAAWSVRGFLKHCDAWCERRVESLQRWAAGMLQWAGEDVLSDVSPLGRTGHKDFTPLSLKEQKTLGGLHAAYRKMASDAGEVSPPPLRSLHPRMAARELLVNIARIRGNPEVGEAHKIRRMNAAHFIQAVNDEFQARFKAGTLSVEMAGKILASTTLNKMGYEAQTLVHSALGRDAERSLVPDSEIRAAVRLIVDNWILKQGLATPLADQAVGDMIAPRVAPQPAGRPSARRPVRPGGQDAKANRLTDTARAWQRLRQRLEPDAQARPLPVTYGKVARRPPPLGDVLPPADMQLLDKLSTEGAQAYARRQRAELTANQLELLAQTMKDSFIEALHTAAAAGRPPQDIAAMREPDAIRQFMTAFGGNADGDG